jgi:hypothetical protein
MSPITFGSVGDIISVSLLVKDLLVALDSSRGSAAEYQAIVGELNLLDRALLQVEALSRTREKTSEAKAAYQTAEDVIEKCRETLDKFKTRIKKYNFSLSAGGCGFVVKDAVRKIQWKASNKDEEIAKLRAELSGYTDTINLLIATANA